jgi:hypothetical protein
MRDEDIIHFWGRKNLRRWFEHHLRDVAIPNSSKSFLVNVGLPLHGDWTLRFDDEEAEDLPRLRGISSYRRIGFDIDVPICLDERRRGCVLEAGQEFGYPERFFNSSVELFAECLIYYQQYRQALETTNRDVQSTIAATEMRMRKADPQAFEDVERCWPVIMKEIRLGRM